MLALCFPAEALASQEQRLTPEDYYALRTVSDPQLSPDGKSVLYVVTNPEQEQNKRHSEIWLAYSDGNREPRQITNSPQSSRSPRWSPEGKSIAFLSDRSPAASQDSKNPPVPKSQVQILSLEGGEAHTLTNLKNGVESFVWSPDGARLVCISTENSSNTLSEDPDKSDTRHYTHPTYKLDGQGFLDDRRQHLWVIDVKSGAAKQVTGGNDWNDTQPQWSPDSRLILFLSDRTGKFWEDLPHSSPSIWVVPAEGGTPTNITGNLVVNGGGQWSPEGKWIAFFAGKFKDDPPELWITSPRGEAKPKQITADLDLSVHAMEWGYAQTLYWLSNTHGEEHIFSAEVNSGQISQVTSGPRFVEALNINPGTSSMAYTASEFEQPGDVYVARLDGTNEKQVSHVNDQLLKRLAIQPVQQISYPVADGLNVAGFLVKPVGWQAGKKYPMILIIHGGPQMMFGTNWMFQVQLYAAHGWAVFYTNPRGSTGYGRSFVEAVIKEWGGKVYSDLMTGVDTALKQNPWIDADELGVTGCSFGGFSTNTILVHTTRFKAAIAMCSISNFVSDEGTRDGYYGHAYNFGGDLYQNFDLYWKYSPIRSAMNVKTPTLILHGEADQRVPLEQAEQWFRALRHFHVPAEFVIFPRESHDGLATGEPKHVVESYHWQIYWFERYLDGNNSARPPDALMKSQ